ncbi:unnamed protein product [Peniophora sp. CBMAI 1063]|nr:unnamed protein product [Peniophora sp. CBMAI 1063]
MIAWYVSCFSNNGPASLIADYEHGLEQGMVIELRVNTVGPKYSPFRIIVKGTKPRIRVTYYYGEEIALAKTRKLSNPAYPQLPTYLNDSQRQATKDACTISSLTTLRIVNNPTAIIHDLDTKIIGVRTPSFYLEMATFGISLLEVEATTDDLHLRSPHTGAPTMHAGQHRQLLRVCIRPRGRIPGRDDRVPDDAPRAPLPKCARVNDEPAENVMDVDDVTAAADVNNGTATPAAAGNTLPVTNMMAPPLCLSLMCPSGTRRLGSPHQCFSSPRRLTQPQRTWAHSLLRRPWTVTAPAAFPSQATGPYMATQWPAERGAGVSCASLPFDHHRRNFRVGVSAYSTHILMMALPTNQPASLAPAAGFSASSSTFMFGGSTLRGGQRGRSDASANGYVWLAAWKLRDFWLVQKDARRNLWCAIVRRPTATRLSS